MSEANKAIVRRAVEEIFNQGNLVWTATIISRFAGGKIVERPVGG